MFQNINIQEYCLHYNIDIAIKEPIKLDACKFKVKYKEFIIDMELLGSDCNTKE